VQEVKRIVEGVTGEPASITPRIGGTLPIIASLHRHLGVPGLAAPDNPWYFGSKAHAPNEHIRLDDLTHAARLTHALLVGLADANGE
jgi:acetylornithine deacetylase/succinyl-diaminopimelate desuccinylase-like protein